MKPKTPARVERESNRAALARVLAAALPALDISQTDLARATGAEVDKVHLWLDPESSLMGQLQDLKRFPRELARIVARDLLAPQDLAVVDAPKSPASLGAREHAKTLARLLKESSDVTTGLAIALADGDFSAADRAKLLREARELAEVVLAFVRDLEADAAVDRALTSRASRRPPHVRGVAS